MKMSPRGIVFSLALIGLLLLSGCTRARVSTGVTPANAAPPAQGTAAAPAAQGTATISLVADKTSISTGDTFKVDIRVSDVQNLYAADVRLQFDPAKLEVVDSNPNVPGTQIEVGKFLDPSGGQGFVAQNSADNAAGRISYAVTLLSPAKPVSGEGALATITFKAKEAGMPNISFLNVLLTNPTNGTITATPRTIGGAPPAGAPAQATGAAPAQPTAAGTARPAVTTAATAAPPAAAPAQATAPAGTASVSIQPATSNITVGATTTLQVRVANVTNMFGADVRLAFDPAILEVEDADPSQAGVQVSAGDCFPAGSQTARNLADNTAGTITYAASRVAPTPAVTGSCTVISFRVKGKASGSSAVNFSRAPQLADTSGQQISATSSNATVTVGGGQPTVPPTTVPGPTATPVPGGGPTTPPTTPGGPTCTHVVQPGETLWTIALRYGTTTGALAAANGISNPNRILVGQRLTIPNCAGPVQPPPPTGSCFTYVVRPGDTLLALAQRYGTSAAAIAQANDIANPHLIRIGRPLVICPGAGAPPPPPPSGPPTGRIHIVRVGDTLSSIALRYNTTPYALTQANGLSNPNLIYVGQPLRVP